jgi:SpoIID/LytB domain protein
VVICQLSVINCMFFYRRRRAYASALLLLVIVLLLFASPSCSKRGDAATSQTRPSPESLDATLENAAVKALGDREGAIIVMDPQTGQLRAVVNPRLAFEQAFPPGSAIKPFTALAAMRAGLIDAESRTACRGRYARDGFQIVCSHPKSNTAFNLGQALAYSCNYYFASLAERLSESAFDSVLLSFGFGSRTGVGAGGEAAGSLPRGEWRTSIALGEGGTLLVTPIQFITAYAALVNGGRLYRPQRAGSYGFVPRQAAAVNLAPAHLSLLLEGMRGAVKYGTAAPADLASLPLYVFGKTGTSTASDGFRTQGWFIGVADAPGSPESQPTRMPSPDNAVNRADLVVLVFLRRSHGAECAKLAREVFAEYASAGPEARPTGEVETTVKQPDPDENPAVEVSTSLSSTTSAENAGAADSSDKLIRVHLVTENVTRTIPLEEYLHGVVAGEASIESEIEALKAQAVVSRTFALKNLGRHSHEGYDFCSTTHCQRYVSKSSNAAAGAVAETAGQVLVYHQDQLIDAYFHAACGGMTANIASLWGVPAPSYLCGVRDDYCAAMPHHSWVQSMPAAKLCAALHGDARTDVGRRLDNIVVTKRDATGRAELVSIQGERRREVSGWDLKIVVGRKLGWSFLKSSRFEVARHGTDFVFRGSGFGHGLGLCQEGAHVMAHRGAAYQQILSHYFPGTNVKNTTLGAVAQLELSCRGGPPWPPLYARGSRLWAGESRGINDADYLEDSASLQLCALSETGAATEDRPYRRLSSDHFRASYSVASATGEIEKVLATLEAARTDMVARLSAAAVYMPESGAVDVVFHATTQDFAASTGEPWWAAGVTHGHTIELQPLSVLRRRGIVTTTLRHEYTHYVIEALGHGRAPRWLAEGLAAFFAGEGRMLSPYAPRQPLTPDEIERRLASRAASPQEMRALYAAAYQAVLAIVQKKGESALWTMAAHQPPPGTPPEPFAA